MSKLEAPVTIKIEPRPDGGIRISSPDEPGLILSGSYAERVMLDVLPAVNALREHAAAEKANAEAAARKEAEWRAAGWIDFAGGECPVAPDTKVHYRTAEEMRHENPSISDDAEGREASTIRWAWKENPSGWDDNIVAYRVVTPSPH